METKETSDIGLFSAFLACGAVFLEADRDDPKHIIFKVGMPKEIAHTTGSLTFAGDEKIPILASYVSSKLNDIEAQWINETLQVNAVIYFNALRRAKSIVHSR